MLVYFLQALAHVVPLRTVFTRLIFKEKALSSAMVASYTAAAAVYVYKRPDPSPSVFGFHEVAHFFITVAASCMYRINMSVITRVR